MNRVDRSDFSHIRIVLLLPAKWCRKSAWWFSLVFMVMLVFFCTCRFTGTYGYRRGPFRPYVLWKHSVFLYKKPQRHTSQNSEGVGLYNGIPGKHDHTPNSIADWMATITGAFPKRTALWTHQQCHSLVPMSSSLASIDFLWVLGQMPSKWELTDNC